MKLHEAKLLAAPSWLRLSIVLLAPASIIVVGFGLATGAKAKGGTTQGLAKPNPSQNDPMAAIAAATGASKVTIYWRATSAFPCTESTAVRTRILASST